jgi:hypothetical protein
MKSMIIGISALFCPEASSPEPDLDDNTRALNANAAVAAAKKLIVDPEVDEDSISPSRSLSLDEDGGMTGVLVVGCGGPKKMARAVSTLAVFSPDLGLSRSLGGSAFAGRTSPLSNRFTRSLKWRQLKHGCMAISGPSALRVERGGRRARS